MMCTVAQGERFNMAPLSEWEFIYRALKTHTLMLMQTVHLKYDLGTFNWQENNGFKMAKLFFVEELTLVGILNVSHTWLIVHNIKIKYKNEEMQAPFV